LPPPLHPPHLGCPGLRCCAGVRLGEEAHPLRLQVLQGLQLPLIGLIPPARPRSSWPGFRFLAARCHRALQASSVFDLASQPATAPATVGTTRKSHSCVNASPPANTAGPRLRAGFTDSPVTLMKGKCRATRVRPMTSPATGVAPFSLVTPRMTVTNRKVATNSVTIAATVP